MNVTRRITWLAILLAGGTGLAVLVLALAFIPREQWGELLPGALLAIGGMTVLGTVLARRLGESLARPLRQVVQAIDQAQLDHELLEPLDVDAAPPAEVAPLLAALRRTQRRLAATMRQVERDSAQMAMLFEHMADGVLVLDSRERTLLCNPAALRLLGQRSGVDRPLAAVVRDPDLIGVIRSAQTLRPVMQVVELRRQSGVPRHWVQVVGARLPDGERTLVLLQDVTDLRRAEAARRDFVANISHELRTPIASLKALAETLELGALDDPEAAHDFVRRMHVEVDGLAHLVSELLELARVESGRLALELAPADAVDLVAAAVDRVRPYAERLDRRIHLAPSSHGLTVLADKQRTGQVLANLLNNAVKFTPPGGLIEAGVRDTGTSVELWVSDTGVGIDPDNLRRVFERFYKTDPSRTGAGTGLGLAICKHLVQAQGGTIWVESEGEGHGATFRFTLPRAAADGLTGARQAEQRVLAQPEELRLTA